MSYLEPQILGASQFNTIKLIDDQNTIDQQTLEDFAPIFMENGMHLCYGLGIQHRHFDLAEDHVLVHIEDDDGIDICRPKPVESVHSGLVPNSLFLNLEGKFQAFEYDFNVQRVPPSDQFLYQLRDFITIRSLSDIIAIVPVPSSEGSVESMLSDEQGTISVPCGRDHDIDLERSVVTAWVFHKDERGVIECRACTWCDLRLSGLHDRKPGTKPKREPTSVAKHQLEDEI